MAHDARFNAPRIFHRRRPVGMALCLLAFLLSACNGSYRPRGEQVEVKEVGRALQCRTPTHRVSVTMLSNAGAVRAWQRARGVTVVPEAASLPEAAYAVIELGARDDSDHSPVISRRAYFERRRLFLTLSVLDDNDARQAKIPSSPCVVMALPIEDFDVVEILDPGYHRLAESDQSPSEGTPNTAK